MKTIWYDENGWVWGVNETGSMPSMEISDEEFEKMRYISRHFAWRLVNGEFKLERFEETPRREWVEDRIHELKRLLADSDYKAIKFAEGQITEEEFAPIRAQRQAWRSEINELEEELSSMSDIQE